MFCRNCGNKVDENAYICVNCGVVIENEKKQTKKKKSGNISGIFSIIFGIMAFILSAASFTVDISNVGMYTEIYEKIGYAIGFTLFSIILTLIALIFALVNKNKICNKIGLGLTLISAFLIVTEFMVVLIY